MGQRLRLTSIRSFLLAASLSLGLTVAAAEGATKPEIASKSPVPVETAPTKAKKKAKRGPSPAKISLRVVNARNGSAEIMSVVRVRGNLWPWVPKQRVEVQFFRNGKRVKVGRVRVRKGKGNFGVFE